MQAKKTGRYSHYGVKAKLQKTENVLVRNVSNDFTSLELIQHDFWQEVVTTYIENKTNTKLEQANHTSFQTQHLFSIHLITHQ